MKRWTLAVALVGFLAPSLSAAADDYPSRPIRAIASQGPGGLSDLFMRALADQLGPALGTAIVVEDRVGAEGTIGAKACADAAADGYTICILPDQTFVTNPLIRRADFDPSKALVPVARPYYLTQMFAINASLGVKSFAELAALVKSKPRTFNYMAPRCRRSHSWRSSTRRTAPTSCACRSRAAATPSTPCSTARRRSRFSASAIWCRSSATAKSSDLPLTAIPVRRLRPRFRRSRKLGYNEHIAATFFGIFAPAGNADADHRQAEQGDRRDRIRNRTSSKSS